jgi:hypothetical protein
MAPAGVGPVEEDGIPAAPPDVAAAQVTVCQGARQTAAVNLLDDRCQARQRRSDRGDLGRTPDGHPAMTWVIRASARKYPQLALT